MPEITLPRKKHSHRCKVCGQGVYCYKTQCQQPQRIEACANCQWQMENARKQKVVRVTFYFPETGREGREQSQHDCDTVEEAFERMERTGMEAIAFKPANETRGCYVWHVGAANTLEALKAKLEATR